MTEMGFGSLAAGLLADVCDAIAAADLYQRELAAGVEGLERIAITGASIESSLTFRAAGEEGLRCSAVHPGNHDALTMSTGTLGRVTLDFRNEQAAGLTVEEMSVDLPARLRWSRARGHKAHCVEFRLPSLLAEPGTAQSGRLRLTLGAMPDPDDQSPRRPR